MLVSDGQNLRANTPAQFSLKVLATALAIAYQDNTYDVDDAQMIVLCLMEQVTTTPLLHTFGNFLC